MKMFNGSTINHLGAWRKSKIKIVLACCRKNSLVGAGTIRNRPSLSGERTQSWQVISCFFLQQSLPQTIMVTPLAMSQNHVRNVIKLTQNVTATKQEPLFTCLFSACQPLSTDKKQHSYPVIIGYVTVYCWENMYPVNLLGIPIPQLFKDRVGKSVLADRIYRLM